MGTSAVNKQGAPAAGSAWAQTTTLAQRIATAPSTTPTTTPTTTTAAAAAAAAAVVSVSSGEVWSALDYERRGVAAPFRYHYAAHGEDGTAGPPVRTVLGDNVTVR
jgi:hypothetical protein